MSTTRTGKIARLPHDLREQLNQRLFDNQCGRVILGWLNALPVVQAMLKADFVGQPVNAPNLTAWRQGGYRIWLLEREARAVADRLARESGLEAIPDQGQVAENLTQWVACRYAVAAARVRDAGSAEEHWRLLREMTADVVQLHRRKLDERRLELEKKRMDLDMTRSQFKALRRVMRSEIRRGCQPPMLEPEGKEQAVESAPESTGVGRNPREGG